jgi:hypothetical protein
MPASVRTAPDAGREPGFGDLIEALECQLHEADARIARLRAMDGRG